jgi:hypothetical protein
MAFAYRGWGLIKRLCRLLLSREESWLVWCETHRSLTWVDTETTAQAQTVTRCLLWPQDHDCDQRCIRPSADAEKRLQTSPGNDRHSRRPR